MVIDSKIAWQLDQQQLAAMMFRAVCRDGPLWGEYQAAKNGAAHKGINTWMRARIYVPVLANTTIETDEPKGK